MTTLAARKTADGRRRRASEAPEHCIGLRFCHFFQVITCASAVLTMVVAPRSITAAEYPLRPIRVLVPYGAGGVADVTMRLLAEKLGNQLKQQFVIENRPGAGG